MKTKSASFKVVALTTLLSFTFTSTIAYSDVPSAVSFIQKSASYLKGRSTLNLNPEGTVRSELRVNEPFNQEKPQPHQSLSSSHFDTLIVKQHLGEQGESNKTILATLVENPKDGKLYVLRHSPGSQSALGYRQQLENEVAILNDLNPDGLRTDLPYVVFGIHHWKSGQKAKFVKLEDGESPNTEVTEIGFLMSYYEGDDGANIMHRNVFDENPAMLWRILLASAKTLQYVSSKGYVHRDIKPSNFMVRIDDLEHPIALIDFELAMPVGQTVEGNIYFARRSPPFSEKTLTRITWNETSMPIYDVFSWGATALYWITDGKYLFPLTSDSRLRPTGVAYWHELLEEAKSPFASIILKALNLDRSLRYQSMDEIVRDLEVLGEQSGFVDRSELRREEINADAISGVSSGALPALSAPQPRHRQLQTTWQTSKPYPSQSPFRPVGNTRPAKTRDTTRLNANVIYDDVAFSDFLAQSKWRSRLQILQVPPYTLATYRPFYDPFPFGGKIHMAITNMINVPSPMLARIVGVYLINTLLASPTGINSLIISSIVRAITSRQASVKKSFIKFVLSKGWLYGIIILTISQEKNDRKLNRSELREEFQDDDLEARTKEIAEALFNATIENQKSIAETESSLIKLRDYLMAFGMGGPIRRYLTNAVLQPQDAAWIFRPFFYFLRFLFEPTIELIAHRFILANQTLENVVPILKSRLEQGIGFTLDIVGDKTESSDMAEHYFQEILRELKEFGSRKDEFRSTHTSVYAKTPPIHLSLKLRALVYELSKDKKQEAKNKLREILRAAKKADAFIRIDAEEYEYRRLMLDIYKEVIDENRGLAVMDEEGRLRMGLVVQVYFRDAQERVLEDLQEWAEKNHYRVPVRLVKGAYYDYEKAQGSPVFNHKESSDAYFEKTAEFVMANSAQFLPAFGTHNLRSISKVIALSEKYNVSKEDVELQMLYGMGEAMKKAIVALGFRFRDYVPYGNLIAGLGYLNRRLVENTSQTSFLVQLLNGKIDLTEIQREPKFQDGDHIEKSRSELRRQSLAFTAFTGEEADRTSRVHSLLERLLQHLSEEMDEPLYADKEDFEFTIDPSAYGFEIGKIKIDYVDRRLLVVRYQDKGRERTVEMVKDSVMEILTPLFQSLLGSEVEMDTGWTYNHGFIDAEKWNGWGSKGHEYLDQYLVYREEIHPAAVKAVSRVLKNLLPNFKNRPVVIADLFGGSGAFLESLNNFLSNRWPNTLWFYHLVEKSAVNVRNYLTNIRTISNISARQQDLTKLNGTLEDLLGDQPDIVTIIGGLNRSVIAKQDALNVAKKIYTSLAEGGYLIVTGYTEVLLNETMFSEIGFEVLNKSIPENIFLGRYPKQLYILRKPVRSELRAKVEVVRLEEIDPTKLAQKLRGKIEIAAQLPELSRNGASIGLKGESYDPRKIQTWIDLGIRPLADIKEISSVLIHAVERIENQAKITVNRKARPPTIQISFAKEVDFFGKKHKSVSLFLDSNKGHLPFHLIPDILETKDEVGPLAIKRSNLDSLRHAIESEWLHVVEMSYGLPTIQARDQLLMHLFGNTDYLRVLQDDESKARAARAEINEQLLRKRDEALAAQKAADEKRKTKRPLEIKTLLNELSNEEPFSQHGPWEEPFILMPENGKPGHFALESKKGRLVQFEFRLNETDSHIRSVAKQALNAQLDRERKSKQVKRQLIRNRITKAVFVLALLSAMAAALYCLPIVRWFQRDLKYLLSEDPAPAIPYDDIHLSVGFTKLDRLAMLVPPGNTEKIDRLSDELKFILEQDIKYAENEDDREAVRQFLKLLNAMSRHAIANRLELNGRAIAPFKLLLALSPNSEKLHSVMPVIDYDYLAWMPRKLRIMMIRYSVNVTQFIHYPEEANNPRALQLKRYRDIHHNNMSLMIQPDGSYQIERDTQPKIIRSWQELQEGAKRNASDRRLLDYFTDPKMADWFKRYVVYLSQPHYEGLVELLEDVLVKIGPPQQFDDYIRSFPDKERRKVVSEELEALRYFFNSDGSLNKEKIRISAGGQASEWETNGTPTSPGSLPFALILSGYPSGNLEILLSPETHEKLKWYTDYTDPILQQFDDAHADLFKPRSELRINQTISEADGSRQLTADELERIKPQYKTAAEFFDQLAKWEKANPDSKLVMIGRHPESMSNLFQYFQSYADYSPLTLRGIQQRNAFTKFFQDRGIKFDRYISSDLERAYELLAPMVKQNGMRHEILLRLREVLLNPLGGIAVQLIDELFVNPIHSFTDDPEKFKIPGYYDGRKTKKYLRKLFFEDIQQNKAKRIAIASHGMTIILALMEIFGIPSKKYRDFWPRLGNSPNVGITVLSYNPKEIKQPWRLLVYGDDSYLPAEIRGRTTDKAEKFSNLIHYHIVAIKRYLKSLIGITREDISDYLPSLRTFFPVRKGWVLRHFKQYLNQIDDEGMPLDPKIENQLQKLGINLKLVKPGIRFDWHGERRGKWNLLDLGNKWHVKSRERTNRRTLDGVRDMLEDGEEGLSSIYRLYFVGREAMIFRGGAPVMVHEVLHDIFLTTLNWDERREFLELVRKAILEAEMGPAAKKSGKLRKFNPIDNHLMKQVETWPVDDLLRDARFLINVSEVFARIGQYYLGFGLNSLQGSDYQDNIFLSYFKNLRGTGIFASSANQENRSELRSEDENSPLERELLEIGQRLLEFEDLMARKLRKQLRGEDSVLRQLSNEVDRDMVRNFLGHVRRQTGYTKAALPPFFHLSENDYFHETLPKILGSIQVYHYVDVMNDFYEQLNQVKEWMDEISEREEGYFQQEEFSELLKIFLELDHKWEMKEGLHPEEKAMLGASKFLISMLRRNQDYFIAAIRHMILDEQTKNFLQENFFSPVFKNEGIAQVVILRDNARMSIVFRSNHGQPVIPKGKQQAITEFESHHAENFNFTAILKLFADSIKIDYRADYQEGIFVVKENGSRFKFIVESHKPEEPGKEMIVVNVEEYDEDDTEFLDDKRSSSKSELRNLPEFLVRLGSEAEEFRKFTAEVLPTYETILPKKDMGEDGVELQEKFDNLSHLLGYIQDLANRGVDYGTAKAALEEMQSILNEHHGTESLISSIGHFRMLFTIAELDLDDFFNPNGLHAILERFDSLEEQRLLRPNNLSPDEKRELAGAQFALWIMSGHEKRFSDLALGALNKTAYAKALIHDLIAPTMTDKKVAYVRLIREGRKLLLIKIDNKRREVSRKFFEGWLSNDNALHLFTLLKLMTGYIPIRRPSHPEEAGSFEFTLRSSRYQFKVQTQSYPDLSGEQLLFIPQNRSELRTQDENFAAPDEKRREQVERDWTQIVQALQTPEEILTAKSYVFLVWQDRAEKARYLETASDEARGQTQLAAALRAGFVNLKADIIRQIQNRAPNFNQMLVRIVDYPLSESALYQIDDRLEAVSSKSAMQLEREWKNEVMDPLYEQVMNKLRSELRRQISSTVIAREPTVKQVGAGFKPARIVETSFSDLDAFTGLETHVEAMQSSVREAVRQIDLVPQSFLTPELGSYLDDTFKMGGDYSQDSKLKRGVILMDTLTREAGVMTPLLVRYFTAQGYEVAVVSDGAVSVSLEADSKIKVFRYPTDAANYLRNKRGAGFIRALGLSEDAGVAIAMKNRGVIDDEKSADSIDGLFNFAAFTGNLHAQFQNAHELIIKA